MSSGIADYDRISKAIDAVSATLWCSSGQHLVRRAEGSHVRRGRARQFECFSCHQKRKAKNRAAKC